MRVKKQKILPRKRVKQWKNKARLEDLSPDGVKFVVNWDELTPGTSLFVPCIDAVECVTQFDLLAKSRRWTYLYRWRVEAGLSGVRFWRLA